MDDTEHEVVLRDDERGSTVARDLVDLGIELGRHTAALLLDEVLDRVGGAFAHAMAIEVDTGHPCRRGERYEGGCPVADLARAKPVTVLSEDYDRASFGRLVRERGELGRFCELGRGDPVDADDLDCLTVAERDRAG